MTNEDKTLLELAAKAAGYKATVIYGDSFLVCEHEDDGEEVFWIEWNPLQDDGGALRLAVKLHFSVEIWAGSSHHRQGVTIVEHDNAAVEFPHDSDPYAATRRAIVRAAAEIGKAMQ